jgi:hypothetical protein
MVLLCRVNIRWSTLSCRCCRNAWSETWNYKYYFLHFCSCITIKVLKNHIVSFVFNVCFMQLHKHTIKVTLRYFVHWTKYAQLIDKLSYCSLLHCSYMFQHYCVIFREFIDSTLVSYISISMQSLVIQFKISHMFFAVESQCLKSFNILKLS